MTAQLTQPVRLFSRRSDAASPRAILFTENLQLPGLIDAVLRAGRLDIQLASARLCGIKSIGQYPGTPDAAIVDLPFDIGETEIIDMTLELRESFPFVHVVLLSGYPLDNRHAERLLCGGVWFLNKPFIITRLAATMRAILETGTENSLEGTCAAGLTSLRPREERAEPPR